MLIPVDETNPTPGTYASPVLDGSLIGIVPSVSSCTLPILAIAGGSYFAVGGLLTSSSSVWCHGGLPGQRLFSHMTGGSVNA